METGTAVDRSPVGPSAQRIQELCASFAEDQALAFSLGACEWLYPCFQTVGSEEHLQALRSLLDRLWKHLLGFRITCHTAPDLAAPALAVIEDEDAFIPEGSCQAGPTWSGAFGSVSIALHLVEFCTGAANKGLVVEMATDYVLEQAYHTVFDFETAGETSLSPERVGEGQKCPSLRASIARAEGALAALTEEIQTRTLDSPDGVAALRGWVEAQSMDWLIPEMRR